MAGLVAGITALGAVMRLVVFHDYPFADELSTYWIISGRSLGQVISTVHTDAEITPPLFFVLSWVATRIEFTGEMLRLPSLIAGVATIPLVCLVGMRTVGRTAALIGTALTALSPFMIYYSAEARGYALMVALSLLSTLAMLLALEDGRARWWVLYAASSCAAVYSHYTAVFALAAQLLWMLVVHREARRPALIANLAAALGFLPWITGLIADLNSPTTKILAALEPFNAHTIATSVEHWSVGYPYGYVHLTAVPGTLALVLMGVGLGLSMVALDVRGRLRPAWLDRGFALVIALALAAPVGEAVVSLVASDVFGTRNLAVSWPGAALLVATFAWAGRFPLRIASTTLLVAGFGIAGAKMLESANQRPDYQAAARFIDENSSPGNVVVDASVYSPGPLTSLELALAKPQRVLRAEAPQERDHPFNLFDPILPLEQVMHQAVTDARGARIFLVTWRTGEQVIPGRPTYIQIGDALTRSLPRDYRNVATRTFPGIATVEVQEYERTRKPAEDR